MLHFFVARPGGGADEVYVQQLRGDRFGFRLSVNGRMQAISAVTLYTVRVEPKQGSGYEWYDYRNGSAGSGENACKILFNSDVLLPGIDVRTQVIDAVMPGDGVLDWRSNERSFCTTADYVSKRTGFALDNITGNRIFTFCTMVLFRTGEVIEAAGGARQNVWQYELFNFRMDVADWPKLDERAVDTPAGKHSHLSFKMVIDRRKIWMHQAEDNPRHAAFPFGFILSIDDTPRTVVGVRMYELVGVDESGRLSRSLYMVGPGGAQAYTLMFNSELLRVGDEKRTLDALLGSVDVLDADSARRKEWVLGEMEYVKRRTRFAEIDGHKIHYPNNNHPPFFAFCTCSAYAEEGGAGWRFRVFEFEVEFGK
jgi:hypothetical protein